ncbi:MAG: hypothetical protein PHW73_14585, partial [Atribacterota bacterium]|nr:hypothetical protein [Atribacterota bacterium]
DKLMVEFSRSSAANLALHVAHLIESPIVQEDKVWLLAHLGWYHCQVNKDMSKALDYLQKGLELNLKINNGVNNLATSDLLAGIANIHMEFYEKSPNFDLFRQQGYDYYKRSLQVYKSLDESNHSLEANHGVLRVISNYVFRGALPSFNEEEKKFCKEYIEWLFVSSEKLLNGKINKEWIKTLEDIKGICFVLKLEEEGKAYSMKKVEEALKNGQETLEEENNSHTTDNNNSNKDDAEDYSVETSGEITDFSSK